MVFGEFQAKNLASSSNELQEHQTGIIGWPSGNILDFRARLPERNGAKLRREKSDILIWIE